ncbi:MAG: hypothetical protein IPJ34_24865 [Myxococcales bacterium]|nr:hypothetical protein [Myxococcales bacterium]
MHRSLAVLALPLLVACGADHADVGPAVMAETDDLAQDFGLSEAALQRLEVPDAAAAVAAVTAVDESSGCKTRVRDPLLPNVVHVHLDRCPGRFGRHVISGEVVVTFSVVAQTLHAEHVGVGLTIDDRPATRHASADITFVEGKRHVVWHGEKSTTDAKGTLVTRVADHVLEVDTATGCSVMNGTAVVTRADRVMDVTLSAVTSCPADATHVQCPTGSIVAVVRGKDATITKTFDGSTTATVVVAKPKGERTREVLLDCVPFSGG